MSKAKEALAKMESANKVSSIKFYGVIDDQIKNVMKRAYPDAEITGITESSLVVNLKKPRDLNDPGFKDWCRTWELKAVSND